MNDESNTTDGCKREIVLRLCVTEAERDMIHEKMSQYGTNNFGAHGCKMLIDGYTILTQLENNPNCTNTQQALKPYKMRL